MVSFKVNTVVLATLINFVLWAIIGYYVSDKNGLKCSFGHGKEGFILSFIDSRLRHNSYNGTLLKDHFEMTLHPTNTLVKYRDNILGGMNGELYDESILIQPRARVKDQNQAGLSQCSHLVNPQISISQECFAVVFFDEPSSSGLALSNTETYSLKNVDFNLYSELNAFNQIRYNANWRLMRRLYAPKESGRMETAGYFKVVGHAKGRLKLRQKMSPLLANLVEIEEYVFEKLWIKGVVNVGSAYSKGSHVKTEFSAYKHRMSLRSGREKDRVVLMVVNEGEMDLFVNFACSCHQSGLSLRRIVVLTSSSHLVPLIDSIGAIGLHHNAFVTTSHKASAEYLDDIFVDMMWYKSFSLYILMRLGVNVLFQDVDLVWFRDPFDYFHELIHNVSSGHGQARHADTESGDTLTTTSSSNKTLYIEALFSDDGQRGVRYTPFFANSGFYYLVSSPRTERLSWSLMTLFDLMQRTGSHQNIMTIRLIEALSLSNLVPVLLDPTLFPNGDQFHHHKSYMSGLLAGLVSPFNFHMCWTKNKDEKIANFKSIGMWYLNEACPFYAAYTNFLNTNHSSVTESKSSKDKVGSDTSEEDDDDN